MTLLAPLSPLPRVSSPFGVPRGATLHNGTDWPAPAGTPLHAMSDGVVEFRLAGGNSGNAVGVRSSDGRTLWSLAHMQDVFVGVGQRVRRGEVIGTVGFTGHVIPAGPAGAHVHVRVERDGQLLDPEKAIRGIVVLDLVLLGVTTWGLYELYKRSPWRRPL